MGEVLERPGRRAEVKVARDEIVVFEFEMAPEKDGAGPHFHKQHVDSFYVLDGELELTVAGEVVSARAGDLVHVEPETVHSFRNASRERVRFLNVHAPGMRFDEYIRRMDANDGPDPEQYDSFLTPAG
jgi:quercetin dioxygenase-like cupin family protein